MFRSASAKTFSHPDPENRARNSRILGKLDPQRSSSVRNPKLTKQHTLPEIGKSQTTTVLSRVRSLLIRRPSAVTMTPPSPTPSPPSPPQRTKTTFRRSLSARFFHHGGGGVGGGVGAGNGVLSRVRSVLVRRASTIRTTTTENGERASPRRSRARKTFRRSLSARLFHGEKSDSLKRAQRRFGKSASWRTDENGVMMTRAMSKKEKYFAEKQDKNIFMKILHPSYHERNQVFKKIFVEKGPVNDYDIFLASYSCAYQREILAQGRMYISQSYVCFYANIIGWETNFVIPFGEIKNITKQKAALIFPNSIQIEKFSGEKFFFASFVNRDKSIQILRAVLDRYNEGKRMTPEEVWEMLNHSEDKAASTNTTPSDNISIPSTATNTSNSTNMTILNNRKSKKNSKKEEKDNHSQGSSSSDFAEEELRYEEDLNMNDNGEEEEENSSADTNFEEIECPCQEHPGRLLMDAVFPISLPKVHELLFTDSPWFDKFNAELKTKNYASSAWLVDKSGVESRNVTYSVPLNHSIAPKSVIVNEKQTISRFPRKEDGVIVFKESQNSGVPYSDSFEVQCVYCISRVGPNECRVKVHGGIHYKKGIWGIVKGYIEKGTNQGLDDHYRLLEKMLKEESVANNSTDQTTSNVEESAALPNEQGISDEITSEIRDRKSRMMAAGDHAPNMVERPKNGRVLNRELAPRNKTQNSNSSLDTNLNEIRIMLIALTAIVAVFMVSIVVILWQIRNFTRPQEPAPAVETQPETSEMLHSLIVQVGQLQSQLDSFTSKLPKKD